MLDELCGQIESTELAVNLNVVGGFGSFVRSLRLAHPFVQLKRVLAQDEGAALQLLSRTHELARLEIDSRFENPYDVALSAYLLALADTGPELRQLAEQCVSAAPNLWWASRVVDVVGAMESAEGGDDSLHVEGGLAAEFLSDSAETFSAPFGILRNAAYVSWLHMPLGLGHSADTDDQPPEFYVGGAWRTSTNADELVSTSDMAA